MINVFLAMVAQYVSSRRIFTWMENATAQRNRSYRTADQLHQGLSTRGLSGSRRLPWFGEASVKHGGSQEGDSRPSFTGSGLAAATHPLQQIREQRPGTRDLPPHALVRIPSTLAKIRAPLATSNMADLVGESAWRRLSYPPQPATPTWIATTGPVSHVLALMVCRRPTSLNGSRTTEQRGTA
jgi:hypothetical protein